MPLCRDGYCAGGGGACSVKAAPVAFPDRRGVIKSGLSALCYVVVPYSAFAAKS